MIRVSLSDHWRIRRSEWLLSLCTFALGLAYLGIPDLFNARWFGPMLAIMSQESWGVLFTLVGLGRLTMLAINGAWRASPHLRAIGSLMSCSLWLTLFVTSIGAEARVQSIGFWMLFAFFDALSAIDAAGDAAIADARARNRQASDDRASR